MHIKDKTTALFILQKCVGFQIFYHISGVYVLGYVTYFGPFFVYLLNFRGPTGPKGCANVVGTHVLS